MCQFTVQVITPRREFKYSTNTAPLKGEDISIGQYIYTVTDVCHMIESYSNTPTEGYLDYLLVRAI